MTDLHFQMDDMIPRAPSLTLEYVNRTLFTIGACYYFEGRYFNCTSARPDQTVTLKEKPPSPRRAQWVTKIKKRPHLTWLRKEDWDFSEGFNDHGYCEFNLEHSAYIMLQDPHHDALFSLVIPRGLGSPLRSNNIVTKIGTVNLELTGIEIDTLLATEQWSEDAN